MKKFHLLFTTFFSLMFFCIIAKSQTPTLIARYDNSNARAMTIDAAGNIYVTGPSDGGKKTGIDFLTVKYNPSGGLVWAARYNYSVVNGEDWPYAIAVDDSGNVLVTGRSFAGNGPKGTVNFDYA